MMETKINKNKNIIFLVGASICTISVCAMMFAPDIYTRYRIAIITAGVLAIMYTTHLSNLLRSQRK